MLPIIRSMLVGKKVRAVTGTKWPAVVFTKSKSTVAEIIPIKLIHARLGRITPTTTKAVIQSGIAMYVDAIVYDIEGKLPLTVAPFVRKRNLANLQSMHKIRPGWRSLSCHLQLCARTSPAH